MLTQALFIRCSSFALALGLLPWSILPLTGRIALALTGLLLFMPALPVFGGEEAVYGRFLATTLGGLEGQGSLGGALLPAPSVLLGEAAIGILLATALSVPIYTAQLAGVWIQRTILQDGQMSASLSRIGKDSGALSLAFVLFSVYVLLHTPWFPRVWEELAGSLSMMPLGNGLGVSEAVEMVISFGARALLGAALLSAPLLGVSIAFYLLLIFAKRYLPQVVTESLALAALQPLLLLGLSLLLFSMAGELSAMFRESLASSRELFR